MFTLKNTLTDEFTNLFFESELTLGGGRKVMSKKISTWVAENLGQFRLNEPHSCIVEFTEDFEQPSITIRGDEDSVRLEIIHIINDNVISL